MSGGWRAIVPEPVRLVLALAAIALSIWIAVAAARPRPALPGDAPATAFSAARAMRDVARIGARPHPTGSAENQALAGWLADRLSGLGLEVERRHYLIDDDARERLVAWSHGTLAPIEMENVLGILPGRDQTLPAVLLTAHYDSVWGSPGAADDGAGVASVLEAVRALRARGVSRRDVVVLFTDAEEVGLAGARAFWDGHGLADRVGVVINLETRGAGGRALMFETGAGNGAMMRLFAASVDRPVANSLATFAYRLMPNRTDYTVARTRGVPGFNFAFTGRAAYYHSPLATADVVDPASVQDMGSQALDIAAALTRAAVLPSRGDDAAFLDLPGGRILLYPVGLGWAFPIAAAVALAFACRRARPSWDAVAAGILVGLFASAAGTLALTVANFVSGSAADPDYYGRLAALPRLELQAALVLTAVMVVAVSLRAPRTRLVALAVPLAIALGAIAAGASPLSVLPSAFVAGGAWAAMPRGGPGAWGGWIGLAVLLTIAGAATQAVAPEGGWLFSLPAVVAALSVMTAALVGRTVPALLVCAAGAIVVAATLLPVAHLAFLNIGAPLPEAMAVAAPILLAAFWPLIRLRPGPIPALAAGMLAIVVGLVAYGVRTAPSADTIPAYSHAMTSRAAGTRQ